MKLQELLSGVPASRVCADPETEITGISYDSRQTQPGDLFVAVAGFATDGHRYIDRALARGAATVLCQRPPEADCPYVLTEDSRLALALVSRNFFGNPAKKLRLIGVTGTNGKTTSTLLIKHILEQTRGAAVGLIGTNGNRIGQRELPSERTTPESYELQRLFRDMADAGCEYAVMEVSSHALALDRVGGLRFDVGAFTNLTQDHLDFHGTMEAYAEAKARLFSVCERAVLNADDAWTPFFRERTRCPAWTYGIGALDASLRAENPELLPDRVRFRAVMGAEEAEVELGIPGRFSVYNALDAMLCCKALGVPLAESAKALRSARGVKGRVEPVPTDGDYTVLIDYAHTPDALENVLRAMRETAPGRVVVLFGCGGDRDRGKRPIMGEIGTRLADFAVITSDNPRTEEPEAIIGEILAGIPEDRSNYIAVTDRREAIAWAIEHHRPGDVIVLAGKGHETYQEIDHVKHPMDEREIVANILERRNKP